MSSDTIEVPALGRPFTLGMLYDARKDELIPGFSLWDKTTLEENTTETPKPGCEFQIMAEDTIDSKSSLLDVEASLKVSVLSGLIKVEGSAKYLNDQKKFKNQSRVTLQYKATTHFKQLSMTELGTQNTQQTDVIKKSSATHVVTGIQYGANAFFVFDSEKLEDSKVQDTQVGMEAVIKKIPSCKPGVEARIQLTDEEKVLTDKFSCKFYGDLLLESNPATFDEAVKTCKELPKLLGKKGENAVPLKVWLMPLKNFDSEAAELKREISVGLMMKAKDALEGVEQTEMRCNDSLADRVSDDFPQMREMLSSFQKLCHNYTSALQQDIKKALPSIREGKEDESSLEKLFEDRDKSPFSQENLNKLMDHKGREINVIRCCVDIINGTGAKIVQSKAELEREVLTPGVEDALCFVFTSLGSTDPFLDAMTKYLDSPEEGSTDEDYGYISDEVLTKMREKAKYFHDVAKGLKDSKQFRFLVAALENKEYTGATIYHYKEGSLVTDDFTKPDVPDVRTAHDRRDLIWYACDLTLDPNTANNNLTLSDENKKATCGAFQAYPDHTERFETHFQVLCNEKLNGRHYWEVEWGNGDCGEVGVAVTYKGIDRKGDRLLSKLGHNSKSWYFGNKGGLQAWHDRQRHYGPLPATDCSRVGVYLDWPAGTLSFYRVSCNTLTHLYTFNTTFTEPVYPAICAMEKPNYVFLCPF
ncbi:stonustoxin subunit beta-like [Thunnus thynnus]|uniref:stonustoxin subunit beta-like n=1 Tax=Thunnus thynnus TaxID=8237 RepID=UPI0035284899